MAKEQRKIKRMIPEKTTFNKKNIIKGQR